MTLTCLGMVVGFEGRRYQWVVRMGGRRYGQGVGLGGYNIFKPTNPLVCEGKDRMWTNARTSGNCRFKIGCENFKKTFNNYVTPTQMKQKKIWIFFDEYIKSRDTNPLGSYKK